MNDQDWLAERFEANRSHLRGVAYRMLGSVTEADDAVQEAWIRLSRTDTSDVDNLRAWLTTVVGRVCLNMLRSRKTRREASLETHLPDPILSPGGGDRSRAGSPAGRLGRARDARRPRLPDARRTGRLRAARRLRRAVRRDRTDRRPDARRRRGSSRAVPVGASRARPCPTSTSMASGPSSTPSSPRRATVTSNASSPSSTRTSSLRSDGGMARPGPGLAGPRRAGRRRAGDDLPPVRRDGDAGPRQRDARGRRLGARRESIRGPGPDGQGRAGSSRSTCSRIRTGSRQLDLTVVAG